MQQSLARVAVCSCRVFILVSKLVSVEGRNASNCFRFPKPQYFRIKKFIKKHLMEKGLQGCSYVEYIRPRTHTMSWYSVTARPFDHQSWKLTLHTLIYLPMCVSFCVCVCMYVCTYTYIFRAKTIEHAHNTSIKNETKRRMQRLHPYRQSDSVLPTTKEIAH
jgi:hypothetical protein